MAIWKDWKQMVHMLRISRRMCEHVASSSSRQLLLTCFLVLVDEVSAVLLRSTSGLTSLLALFNPPARQNRLADIAETSDEEIGLEEKVSESAVLEEEVSLSDVKASVQDYQTMLLHLETSHSIPILCCRCVRVLVPILVLIASCSNFGQNSSEAPANQYDAFEGRREHLTSSEMEQKSRGLAQTEGAGGVNKVEIFFVFDGFVQGDA
eukprot:751458-Hanusia_phi.AAC.1